MNEARTLDQLQTLDLEIDALTQELEDVQARIGETEELTNARQRLDDARRNLQELQSAQQEQEWEVDRLSEKIAAEEERLFGGRIRNPKELDGIRKEVENLKRHRTQFEDRILELMSQVEEAQQVLATSQAELARIGAEWEAQQRELAERQSQISARLAELQRARRALASTLPAPILATYEDLRRTKRGRGVAHVERNTCQGCRISLPMSIVQHARAGRELVYCPSCGRILYAER